MDENLPLQGTTIRKDLHITIKFQEVTNCSKTACFLLLLTSGYLHLFEDSPQFYLQLTEGEDYE